MFDLSKKLKMLAEEAVEKLNSHRIKHGPTIGDMYEGLTKEILNHINLNQYGMKICKGFIQVDDEMSPQIDLMIVKGDGEKIPNTDYFIYTIDKLVAVIEVKKNLYLKEINSAYTALNAALHLANKYYRRQSHNELKFYTRPAEEFKALYGHYPASECGEMTFEKIFIYKTLIDESLSPLRIAIGYNGFKSEKTFRKGIAGIYNNKELVPGYGAKNMPNLITCGDFSCVKTNGMPYIGHWSKIGWSFLATSNSNPFLLLLEVICDRIELITSEKIDRGQDDNQEVLTPLMSAFPVGVDEGVAWSYSSFENIEMESTIRDKKWAPVPINKIQHKLIDLISISGRINLSSDVIIDFINKNNIKNFSEVLGHLVSNNLVADIDGDLMIAPAEVKTALIDGELYCASNVGRIFEKWIQQFHQNSVMKW